MATAYLHCDECGKTLKTFQALLKHFAQRHAYRQLPRRAVFTEGEQQIKLMTPEAIRSPAVRAEYKAWLVGVTERINGIHHHRHKRNWQTIEFNMVPYKFFQQLLKDLDNPQPNAVRNMSHWRPPILKSCARKITYRLFDIKILKEALQKQTTLPLKEQVHWSGDREACEVPLIVDPREALAAAKNRAHRQGSRNRITSQSNLVVGHGEGRASRELDLIWWSNLYNAVTIGKLAIRLYVNRVELF